MKGERIAQLELLLRSHPEGIRKSEIARRLAVHRSTIGRYIDELAQYNDIYEENGLIKIRTKEKEDQLSLSIYEGLALNLGAEVILSHSEYQNPHLASGLKKIAMNMKSYAPQIASNIINLADEIDKASFSKAKNVQNNTILEVLIDSWVSGRIARIFHSSNGQYLETELAPYFIGFVESENGRNPITVTGRLRHTAETVTINIANIIKAEILDETYTIPDNLKALKFTPEANEVNTVVDTIPLQLIVREKSALNSFRILAHSEIKMEDRGDGTWLCSFDAENSIELILRIIQCFNSVEIVGPERFRTKFVKSLSQILEQYK